MGEALVDFDPAVFGMVILPEHLITAESRRNRLGTIADSQ